MKRTIFHAILAVVVGLCVSAGVFAQASRNDIPAADKYIISARAGAVNYLEGSVSIIRAAGKSGVLLKRDVVEVGDRVTAGPDGKAEILLNPGSFIRLGSNSSFEFGTTDLEDLQIRLDSGSAMFEVFAADEFRVSVFTPKGKLALIDTGIYRVDVSTDGTALLSVIKGKAEIGEGTATLIKDGRTGTVGTDTVAIAKFDKDKRDDLAEWSKMRSKELTKMNSALNGQPLINSLMTGFRRGAWGMYDSFGLWVYNAAFGGYCFLPFGNGWRSPYGGWYGNGIYPYWPGFYNPTGGGGGYVPPRKVSSRVPRIDNTGDGTGKVSTRMPRGSGADESTGKVSTRSTERTSFEPPPFTKVGRGSDVGIGFGGGRVDSKGDFSSDRTSPSYSSPSNSAPSYSPPPPPPSAPAKVSSRDNN
ncbi:MAG: FecR family protein [Pyrinomonadaceae bacterium]